MRNSKNTPKPNIKFVPQSNGQLEAIDFSSNEYHQLDQFISNGLEQLVERQQNFKTPNRLELMATERGANCEVV